MCNLYRMEKAPDAILGLARELGMEVGFPEGVPNFEPRDVRITERAPLLRRAAGGAVELVERRWSWPGPTGKPVFNFRGEGRRFAPAERCVVLADGFYEFTTPEDPKAKRKDRWLFEWPQHPWFGIAGIVRADPTVGEAFTLLTCEPGARRQALPQPPDRAAEPRGLLRLARPGARGGRVRPPASRRHPQGPARLKPSPFRGEGWERGDSCDAAPDRLSPILAPKGRGRKLPLDRHTGRTTAFLHPMFLIRSDSAL